MSEEGRGGGDEEREERREEERGLKRSKRDLVLVLVLTLMPLMFSWAFLAMKFGWMMA
jgi:hypothetical protein